jgi:putative ABC transport system ATP-binding protein
MLIVKTQNLAKSYFTGDVETKALRGVDIQIKKGEFVGIMGPSGSGKSTLLYQLGLIDVPTGGKIFIEGEDVSHFHQQDRDRFRLYEFGFVFQDYALIPELSAAENIMVPLMMKGNSKSHAQKTAMEILDRFGLNNRLNNLPSQLSGGEQQRVSVARAIAHKPKILFADEPTANLDSDKSHQLIELFLDLNKAGQTIVMVTHEQEYGNMAQRLIHLKDGLVVKNHLNGRYRK